MAVVLSTVDTGQLTGLQHRAINHVLGEYTDYVIGGCGNELVTTQQSSINLLTGTGILIMNGVVIEVTSTQLNSLGGITEAGTGMIIAKADLNTKVATVEMKLGTTLTQNDLIATPTGTREVELYRFVYNSSGAITSLTDNRVIKYQQNPYQLDLAPVKSAGGTLLPINYNMFIPSSDNIALTTSYPQTIGLSRIKGNLAIASDVITLPAGFYYVVETELVCIGTGDANGTFKVYDTSNIDKTTRPQIWFSSTATSGQTNARGYTLIDLTGEGAVDLPIKIVNTAVAGTTPKVRNTAGQIVIQKMIKVNFTNL